MKSQAQKLTRYVAHLVVLDDSIAAFVAGHVVAWDLIVVRERALPARKSEVGTSFVRLAC